MRTRHSTMAAITAVTCAAALTLAGCGGGGGSSLAKFCKDGEKLGNQMSALDNIDATDPSALSQVKDASSAVRKFANEAPAAIKADAKALADGFDEAVKNGSDSIDQSALQGAADRVDAYASAHCTGASLSGDSASSDTTTTDTVPTTFDTVPNTPETTAAPSISMPNLTNSTLDDAKSSLTDAGLTSDPVVVEEQSTTVAPGLVITQDPLPGSYVSDTTAVTLTISKLPSQVYLSDLQASAGGFSKGVATIKGTPYTHGVLQQQGSGYNPAKTTFTLSSHYNRLKGVVGLDDSFTGGASVQVEVFDQNNRSLFKKIVKVGQPVTLDISVSGVIQLTLEATDLLTNVQNSGTVVWGDAQVLTGR